MKTRTARSLSLALPALALGLLAATPAEANPRGVGLGAAAGVALPDGKIGFDPTFNWGFFVDIPLIYTFHITPSTLVYKLTPKDSDAGAWTTDVSLNFKFIVPIGPLSLFGGVLAGVTAAQDLEPHVGLLGGGSFNLVSNVDLFVQVNYKLQIRDDDQVGNIRDLQIYVGPLFRFQ